MRCKGKMEVKTYVVLQRVNLPKVGEANAQILHVKLTRQAAQDIVDLTPGTWIERHVATK